MAKLLAIGAAFTLAALSLPAVAADIVVPLGVIVVPPTQTFSPGITFTDEGANSGLYEFVISQEMTLTVSSFTNSAFSGDGMPPSSSTGFINATGSTGEFEFSSIGLFSGLGNTGTLLQSGSITPRTNGTEMASLGQFSLSAGTYTIAYSGTVTGAPAGVGSSITFAAGNAGAVPESASWAMMISGFGLVGAAARRTRRTINFAV